MIKKIIIILMLALLNACPVIAYEIVWERTSGPYGGYIEPYVENNISWLNYKKIIATYESGNLVVYRTTQGRGVAKSVDGGITWSMMSGDPNDSSNDGLVHKTTSTLCFDPSDSSRIFAGTVGMLYMTEDAGVNWSAIGNTLSNKTVYSIAVDGNKIFAVFFGDLYRLDLDDVSPTWESIDSSFAFSTRTITHDPINQRLYAVCHSPAFYVSTNEGDSWSLKWSKPSAQTSGYFVEMIKYPSSTEIYVEDGKNVVRSIDGGETWIDDLKYSDYRYNLAINPGNPDFAFSFYGTDYTKLKRTTDHGASWAIKNSGLPTITSGGPRYTAELIVPNPDYPGSPSVFVVSSNGLYLSTDAGDNFVEINGQSNEVQVQGQSFVNVTINDLAVDDNGIIYAGGRKEGQVPYSGQDGHGIFKSHDSGETWQRINNGLVGLGISDIAIQRQYSPNNIVYVANQSGIFKSLDNGNYWETNSSLITNCFAVNEESGEIFAGTVASGVYKGIEGSSGVYDWQSLPRENLLDQNITSLDIDLDGNIYAGTNQGGIYKFEVGATSWEVLDDLGVGVPGPISVLSVDPATSEYIYVGAGRCAYWSVDFGETWDVSKDFGGQNYVSDIFIDSDSLPSHIYMAAANSGLWKSIDNGYNWSQINISGMGADFSETVYSIARDENTKTFYLGNLNIGVSKGVPNAGIPETPAALEGVAVSKTSIDWTWTDNSTTEFAYKFIKLEPGTGEVVLPMNSEAYFESNLYPNTIYTREVVAYNTQEGTASNTALECTWAIAPTNLRATSWEGDRIRLNWDVDHAGLMNPAYTKYAIEMSVATTGAFTPDATREVSVPPPYYFDFLLPQNDYRFRVRAENLFGVETVFSNLITEETIHETLGPEISDIRFDGRPLYEGDIVMPDPVITARIRDRATTPESPTAIPKDSITLIFADYYQVDGEQIDSLVPAGDYYDMQHEIKVPIGAGEHTFYIEAYDELGNRGRSTPRNIRVIAGKVKMIGEALAYPAPFSPKSGQDVIFTYNLSTDAPVSIHLFDVSGRVMWTKKFTGGVEGGRAGYNEVRWNGRTDFGGTIGNGIFIFQVSVKGRKLGSGKLVVFD